jgi:hypothetical protein
VFENKLLRIFAPKEKVRGGWRKFYNEGPHEGGWDDWI